MTQRGFQLNKKLEHDLIKYRFSSTHFVTDLVAGNTAGMGYSAIKIPPFF